MLPLFQKSNTSDGNTSDKMGVIKLSLFSQICLIQSYGTMWKGYTNGLCWHYQFNICVKLIAILHGNTSDIFFKHTLPCLPFKGFFLAESSRCWHSLHACNRGSGEETLWRKMMQEEREVLVFLVKLLGGNTSDIKWRDRHLSLFNLIFLKFYMHKAFSARWNIEFMSE